MAGNPNIADAGKNTQFKKGQKVNRPGRPKKQLWLERELDKVLASKRFTKDKQGVVTERSNLEILALRLHELACAGNGPAIDTFKRIYTTAGVDRSKLEITGADGAPLKPMVIEIIRTGTDGH